MVATTVLERVIAARRGGEAAPTIDTTVARLCALHSEPAPTNEQPAPLRTVDASGADAESERSSTQTHGPGSRSEHARVWRFEFVPTTALSERGVNVNSVRARLQEIGEILQAAPHVRGEGRIIFEFVVSTAVEESTFAGWHEENLTYTRVEEANTDATGASRTTGRAAPASDPDEDARTTTAASAASMLAPSNVVRVDLARLDELMRLIGELVTSRARLDESLKHLKRTVAPAEWRALQETSLAMS